MSTARNNRSRRSGGFSLAEAVVAMGVLSILLLGMGGAITMSVSALDQGRDVNADAVKAAEAADRMLADLREALRMSAPDAETLEIEVPDRDGDDIPEVISYSWASVSADGGPIKRSVNGDTPQVLMAKVTDLKFGMSIQTSAATTGTEQRLIGYDTSLGATLQSHALATARSAAQYVKPAMASNVTAWSITRVRLRLARDSTATGTLRVSLVTNSNWTPTGTVLAKVDLAEASLPAASSWVEVVLGAGPLAPDQGVFIKLEDISSTAAGTIEYGSGGNPMPYNTFFTTATGTVWSAPQDASDMRFEVYGTLTTN